MKRLFRVFALLMYIIASFTLATSALQVDITTPPDTTPPDTTPPTITLNGSSSIVLHLGSEYVEQGAEAIDDFDGDISDQVVISGAVNTDISGIYTVTYTATDAIGNIATATRSVKVLSPNTVIERKRIFSSGGLYKKNVGRVFLTAATDGEMDITVSITSPSKDKAIVVAELVDTEGNIISSREDLNSFTIRVPNAKEGKYLLRLDLKEGTSANYSIVALMPEVCYEVLLEEEVPLAAEPLLDNKKKFIIGGVAVFVVILATVVFMRRRNEDDDDDED